MIRTLPVRPHLGFLKHQARDLQRSHQKKDPSIGERLRRLTRFQDLTENEVLNTDFALHEAQYVLALEYGFSSWNALKAHVESCSASNPQPYLHHTGDRVWIEGIPELGWGKSGECTYAGALSVALSITNHPFSYAEIMGLTGLAFRFRWWQPGAGKRGWCGSSPVGEFPAEKSVFQRLSGWEFADVDRMAKEEDPHMEVFYEPILDSIDMGYPVIGYPEKGDDLNVAIAFGYERSEDATLISWNFYWNSEPKTVPVERLGPWFAYPVDFHPGVDPQKAIMEAIQGDWWRDRGVLGNAMSGPGYLLGDSAFRQWIQDLADVDGFTQEQRKSFFFVSWWCFDCLHDARMSAVTFLKEKASLFENEIKHLLQRAADVYTEEAAILLMAFQRKDVFLGPWSGKTIDQWTPEIREHEISLLESVRQLESRALSLLDEAVSAWMKGQPVRL